MRKAFKIILAVFAVLIIIVVAFGAIFFLDVAAYTAAGAKTLTPTGTSAGNALVVYDPGWSGQSTKVAEKVAADLQAKGYTVTLTGVKSGEAANTAGYSIIVAGGPNLCGYTNKFRERLPRRTKPSHRNQSRRFWQRIGSNHT
jgi:hypothetical protein